MMETECVTHFWTRWDASSDLACMWCHKTHTRHLMDENMIDASPKEALPMLPDDFSESKDWRAGGYAERIEWLMDTVRSQREHIAALLDNH